MMPQQSPNRLAGFSLSQARSVVHDLFQPNPWIYWFDFLGTYFLALYCFQAVRGGNLLTPHQGFTGEWSQAVFFVLSCLLFYRAGMFIHELVHQKNTNLTGFGFVWNLLCGIPFLMPSFVYYTHIDHHRRMHYGTEHDGEYLPLRQRPVWFTFFYLSWSLVIPILVILRFTFLTPVAWCVPKTRQWIHRHISSLVMDPTYIRPLPTKKTLRTIYLQEFGCLLWCWGMAIIPFFVVQRFPWPFLVHAYFTSVFVIALNSVRTLGSHRWSNAGGEMTFTQQLLDSVNFPRSPFFSEIWGPVGTRYHALHHVFPTLPYHSLAEAHKRLMSELPADSPYRRTEATSLSSVVLSLLRTPRKKTSLATSG